MNPTGTSGLQTRKATRSSLACLPCRSRHLKCDGKQPCCDRCAESDRQCMYARSRRGGLDRARLAERRRRLAAGEDPIAPSSPRAQRSANVQQDQGPSRPDMAASSSDGLFDGSNAGDESFDRSSSTPVQVHVHKIENDALVDAYYNHFHKLHPFVLPKNHLVKLYYGRNGKASFIPLIAILRFIGKICSSQEWSVPLKDYTEASFSQASLTDPIMVQCRLLYSIVLLWYGFTADAKREMDSAIRLAVDLQMFRREFAAEHAAEDPVLRECWRRTWWMLCAVDVYYAGTLGTSKFVSMDVESTVELPCEESDYESGDIPEPKSVQDFDGREFSPDNTVFSSFAYLIGAVRCVALAMSTMPNMTARECSMHVIQVADPIIDGWLLLLPKGQKEVMTKTGEIDELMFQAHLVIHIVTIVLHRPFSDLKFNPVEGVSSCAREPPPDSASQELVSVHTARVLRAVEAQIRVLALPAQQFHHTPFTTCMVTGGTLALLSACNFLLKGTDFAIARGQIRMTIGRLKVLSEQWPRAAKNLREIQTIAHHVLGLESKTASSSGTPKSSEIPRVAGVEESITVLDAEEESSAINDIPFLGDIDSLCGWYNFGNLDPDLPWGVGDGSEFVT